MTKRALFVPTLIVGALICNYVISTWGVTVGVVKGSSMEPTFYDGNMFVVQSYKLLYRNPQKGEVVVLKDNNGFTVIKRVVLTPGELDTYSPSREVHTLKPDEYVVLGDNRDHSSDSREYGPVHRNQLIGIVQ